MAGENKSKTPFEDLARQSSNVETSPSVNPSDPSPDEPPPYSAHERSAYPTLPEIPPSTAPEVTPNHPSVGLEAVTQETTSPGLEAVPQGSSSAAGPSRAPQTPGYDQRKAIAIPAIDSSAGSPFIRAYAPILHNYKISKKTFLNFLDQLNDVMTTSPPMQVLDATGGILKSVPILFPLHWIGSAVSGIASLGGQGISKGRSDSAIKQANKEIFGPRGLQVEIGKLDALAHLAKMPILDSQGKVNRQAPLLLQLTESVSMPTNEPQELDLQQRRIRALQPWIAELEVDVLPWTSKSRLTRFNAALKKRNDPRRPDSAAHDGDEAEENHAGFRKCLWLIIR
ncbi:uncharacterized protein N7482_005518 [Penicillium canariense]|uniref:Uncharacterized protein n=1 Tax=Penicillium canariense TaxID=189055 RepID=A0A9W9LMM4_9EURO|nr:uncharacterized protein N7482_005518 [Penicillium canariense]KAJ5166737.1 hypothetical protein N7482_005518 [Penicillium canariense]